MMKRSLVPVLVMGLAAAAIAVVLHALGLLRPIEHGIGSVLEGRGIPTITSEIFVYLSACVLGVVVAWLTVNSIQRLRIGLLVAGLALELVVAAWICGLYGGTFQPLPAIIASVVAFVATERWLAFIRRSRTQLARTFFADRLSNKQIRSLVKGDIPLETHPNTYV